MLDDKEKHFYLSAIGVILISCISGSVLLAGGIMLTLGVCKELFDEFYGSGFDLHDIKANMLGIVSGMMISFLLIGIAEAVEQPNQTPSFTEWARAEWKQHNGIMYLRVPIAGMTWCFTRSTDNIVSKSDEWELVAPSVLASIPASIEQVQVCTDTLPPTFWVVAKNPKAVDNPPTRPLKNEQMVDTWRILVGIPCEPETINVIKAGGAEYHHAVNSDGQRGITVCTKSQ